MLRHELTDEEWTIIAPLLPNKVQGMARGDDRQVIKGILWRFLTGAPPGFGTCCRKRSQSPITATSS